MIARAEVWWYERPHREPRPHLILSRDDAIPFLNRVLGAPITRTARGIATEVELDPSDGMPQACVVSLDNMRTISPAYCTRRITKLGPERMHRVCLALRNAIDC